MKVIGIYGLRNIINGKWYVGRSKDIHKRWHTAYELMQCKRQPKIFAALKKYGYDNFEKVVLEECDKDLLVERETYWIRHHNCVIEGYNVAEDGQSGGAYFLGKHHTAEARKKVSIFRRGRKLSKAHKQAISKSVSQLERTPLSELTRQKISSSLKGRFYGRLSDQRRLKNALYDNTEYTFHNILSGEVTKCFRSDLLRSHPEINGTGLRKLVNGKWSQYKNWTVTSSRPATRSGRC